MIVVLTYLALNECRTYTVKSLACVADEIASKTVARSAFSAPTEECHLALARIHECSGQSDLALGFHLTTRSVGRGLGRNLLNLTSPDASARPTCISGFALYAVVHYGALLADPGSTAYWTKSSRGGFWGDL